MTNTVPPSKLRVLLVEIINSPAFAFATAAFLTVLSYKMTWAWANTALVAAWVASSLAVWKKLARRRIWATVGYAVPSGLLLYSFLWTPSPPDRDTIDRTFRELGRQGDWAEMAKQLPSVESAAATRDLGLFFRGVLSANSKPRGDAERYWSAVPQESEYFAEAQEMIFANLPPGPASIRQQGVTTVLASLEKAGLRNALYFRLRLERTIPPLTYAEVSELYRDFRVRFEDLFDFQTMKSDVRAQRGIPVNFRMFDAWTAQGCAFLFWLRFLEAAQIECSSQRKTDALKHIDILIAADEEHLKGRLGSLGMLHTDYPSMMRAVEALRSTPLGKQCPEQQPR